VFDTPGEDADEDALRMYKDARALRNEWVIAVAGKVRPRGPERENPKLPTGMIEVVGTDLEVLNRSDTIPFEVDEYADVAEETRLRFRYIDLRRPWMTDALRRRHAICRAMRTVLDDRGFVEVETPFLTKSTPEGARDFLVPCRLQEGTFYALPQSPQLFKQLLMVGGLDRYYQIVRCFRDEDLRADRQPEFTQLDVEMSFVTEQDVMDATNEVMRSVCRAVGKSFPDTVRTMSYAEAVGSYGTDRPDLRYELKLHDVGDIVRESEFKVFSSALDGGGVVKAICPPGGAKFTRKEIDAYTVFAGQYGAKGLAWCKVESGGFAGGTAKFIPEGMQAKLRETCGANDGDILFFVADKPVVVNRVLAALRCKLADDLQLYDSDEFAWCWVTDFPLVEWSEEDGRWYSLHHPFTAPRPEDMDKLESDPGSALSRAYDIVCNGLELGGGSIRNHEPDTQQRILRMLGIEPDEAQRRFGFFLKALRYGAPPHGGIALGLDRIVMLMAGGQSLRDVIAFPKTQRGTCPLTGTPSEVDEMQLAELSLRSVASAKSTEQS
ncbi:MAG: aspartate--tRNA ligase, partial [Planctomycetota bacterium]